MKKYIAWLAVIGIFALFASTVERCSQSGKAIPSDTVNIDDYESGDGLGYKIGYLIKEDIFKVYPELENQYPTDLSRENFLKSEEAKNIRKKMTSDLHDILQKTYKIDLHQSLGKYSVDQDAFVMNIISKSFPCKDDDNVRSTVKALSEMSHSSNGFWFKDVPFRVRNDEIYIFDQRVCNPTLELVLRVKKDLASNLEPTQNELYLIFNPKDSLTNDYVKTKDVALVIVDQSTHKTLYVIKFSNFDEKKAWKNKAEFQQSIPSTNTQQTDGQNTQALIDLGNNMKNSGKFQEAIDAYQKVLQLTPNNDEVAVDIGNCYLAMKMRETAMESYKKAISINPNNYRAHWDLGLIFIVQGREAEARGEMKKAIEIISNMPDTDKSKQIMEEIKGKLNKLQERIADEASKK